MNDLTTKQDTQMVAAGGSQGGERALNSDIVIPKLLLMQGLSDFVSKRKAQIGDMVRSTNIEKLGDPEVPVEFIPVTFTNEWRLEESINNKFEYRGREPRTSKNEDLSWDFEKNGAKWKRTKVINVFGLLPKDIAAEQAEIARAKKEEDSFDLNKVLMPIVISFRSTSYNAGKSVVTHFAKAQSMAEYGAKAYGYTMTLKCVEDKNDKGTFFVFEATSGKKVDKDSMAKAEKWQKILSTQAVQIDESDEAASTGEYIPGVGKVPAF